MARGGDAGQERREVDVGSLVRRTHPGRQRTGQAGQEPGQVAADGDAGAAAAGGGRR